MADSTFPFKLTEDLKTIVDKRIKEAKADFVQIPKEEIMDKDLSLPDIEPISFRILNFKIGSQSNFDRNLS